MATATAVKIGNKTAVKIALAFGEMGYVGKPYWPEIATLIDIGKQLHPKWKNEKRQQAINAELEKRGLTQADYERLQLRAARQFYTDTDADDGSGEIVIPRHVLTGMLAQTLKTAPKNAIPKVEVGLLHIGFQMQEPFLRTGLTKGTAMLFSRFVKNEESNQRRYESSPYIGEFVAKGTLMLDEAMIKADDLEKIMEFAGRYVGLGSCRNQGYGHFLVSYFDVVNP